MCYYKITEISFTLYCDILGTLILKGDDVSNEFRVFDTNNNFLCNISGYVHHLDAKCVENYILETLYDNKLKDCPNKRSEYKRKLRIARNTYKNVCNSIVSCKTIISSAKVQNNDATYWANKLHILRSEGHRLIGTIRKLNTNMKKA